MRAELRDRWIAEELSFDPRPVPLCWRDEAWAEAAAAVHPVIWFSRHSAQEYAGFMEVLWRRNDLPTSMVDVTDLVLCDRDGVQLAESTCKAFAYINSAQFVSDRLLERTREVTPEERLRYRDAWEQLKSENAAVRIVAADRMLSAPITHYDAVIVSNTSQAWQSLNRVVGMSIVAAPCDTDFISARVLALADDGLLELDGEDLGYEGTRVRRPSEPDQTSGPASS